MSAFPSIHGQGRGRFLTLVVVTALLQAGAAAISAVATRDVFATFLAPAKPLPVAALTVLAASGIVIAVGRVAQAMVSERLGQSFAGDLRERLFTHLSRMPRMAVQNQRRGGLSLRFVGDLSSIRNWVGDAMPKLIAAGFVLPAACGAGILLHPLLGAVLTTCVCAGLVAMTFAARTLRRLHRALRRQRARLSADMSERAPQAPDLRLIGRMDHERERLRTRTRSLTEAATARRRAGAVMRAIPDVIAAIAAAMVLATALHLDLPASLAAGGLAAAAIFVAPLRDLAMIWDRYNAFVVARSKCLRVFRRPILLTFEALPSRPSLTFEDVSHGPLQNLSFHVPVVGLLRVQGSNGTGKTTLLRLAAGLEEPDQGRVLIGKHPATSAAPEVGICLIDTHTPILAGSLRRCLTLGAVKRPSDAQILEATTTFGLETLLHRLDGLDGRVSELGRNISEGERWRVLLARASLTKARLILLDCPEGALDLDSLDTIVQCLANERTTLIITERERNADLQQGETPSIDLSLDQVRGG
ncbi:MAG: ABC transporter ATP-binding protein [Pseudomonadota bacterium]